MIYWTMNSVPELNGLDKAEKKKMFKQAFKEGRSRMGMKELAIRMVAYIALIAVAFGLLSPPFFAFSGGSIVGMALIGGILGALAALPAILMIQTPIIEKSREWLREQGYPTK
mgnify:FL=1